MKTFKERICSILFVLFILCACQKDKFNFLCDCVYYFNDGVCNWTMTFKGLPHNDLSNDEMQYWIDSQTNQHYFLIYGHLWRVSADCHCSRSVCFN
jgi:hypothetical protein